MKLAANLQAIENTGTGKKGLISYAGTKANVKKIYWKQPDSGSYVQGCALTEDTEEAKAVSDADCTTRVITMNCKDGLCENPAIVTAKDHNISKDVAKMQLRLMVEDEHVTGYCQHVWRQTTGVDHG